MEDRKSIVICEKLIKHCVRMYDVVWVDMGEDETICYKGQHPAIIIQNNSGNYNSDYTIVMFGTTKIKKEYLPSNFVIKQGSYGLTKDTMFMANMICSIHKSKIFDYIGFIDDEDARGIIVDAYMANITGKRDNFNNDDLKK